MKIINKISDFIELRCQISKKIALVPTMGSIHEGHISLVETAKKHGDTVVATIFVNPIQFNNTEDYISYPKNFDKDVIVGIHLKDTGKLPSGANIIGLKEILSNYKIRAVIGGCISPEIYQKVYAALKQLNYDNQLKKNGKNIKKSILCCIVIY